MFGIQGVRQGERDGVPALKQSVANIFWDCAQKRVQVVELLNGWFVPHSDKGSRTVTIAAPLSH